MGICLHTAPSGSPRVPGSCAMTITSVRRTAAVVRTGARGAVTDVAHSLLPDDWLVNHRCRCPVTGREEELWGAKRG